MTTTTVDDSMLDEEWLAAPRKRSRSRLVMVAALIAAVCFLGGALAQKHLGADDAAATGPGGLAGGLPEGFPTGGGFPGAAQQGAGTTPQQTDDEAGADDQVIGTVIKKNGTVWVVEDLGGKRHEITVADTTQIVRESELTPAKVRTGDRVQVTGVERQDRLQAADITLR